MNIELHAVHHGASMYTYKITSSYKVGTKGQSMSYAANDDSPQNVAHVYWHMHTCKTNHADSYGRYNHINGIQFATSTVYSCMFL